MKGSCDEYLVFPSAGLKKRGLFGINILREWLMRGYEY